MCYALFIAVDQVLPVVDIVDADDRFHLEIPQSTHSEVLAKFSKPHVYYASSWEGCGCGWFSDPDTLEAGRDGLSKTAQCLRELSALMSQVLEDSDSAELFLTWEGEVGEPVRRRRVLSPSDFKGESLPLEQGDFVTVTAAGTG